MTRKFFDTAILIILKLLVFKNRTKTILNFYFSCLWWKRFTFVLFFLLRWMKIIERWINTAKRHSLQFKIQWNKTSLHCTEAYFNFSKYCKQTSCFYNDLSLNCNEKRAPILCFFCMSWCFSLKIINEHSFAFLFYSIVCKKLLSSFSFFLYILHDLIRIELWVGFSVIYFI